MIDHWPYLGRHENWNLTTYWVHELLLGMLQDTSILNDQRLIIHSNLLTSLTIHQPHSSISFLHRKKAIILSYKEILLFQLFPNEFLLEILIKHAQKITLLARIFISWKSPSITLWTWLNVNDEWVKKKKRRKNFQD